MATAKTKPLVKPLVATSATPARKPARVAKPVAIVAPKVKAVNAPIATKATSIKPHPVMVVEVGPPKRMAKSKPEVTVNDIVDATVKAHPRRVLGTIPDLSTARARSIPLKDMLRFIGGGIENESDEVIIALLNNTYVEFTARPSPIAQRAALHRQGDAIIIVKWADEADQKAYARRKTKGKTMGPPFKSVSREFGDLFDSL